jgi:hypothetical protein
VFLGDNFVSLSSKCYNIISYLSAKAEYRAVANGVVEACWLYQLLLELHSLLLRTTLVYYNNVSAVYLSINPVQHQRTKHVELDRHFVRECIIQDVHILHVPTTSQFADIFTKGLPSSVFLEFRSTLIILWRQSGSRQALLLVATMRIELGTISVCCAFGLCMPIGLCCGLIGLCVWGGPAHAYIYVLITLRII